MTTGTDDRKIGSSLLSAEARKQVEAKLAVLRNFVAALRVPKDIVGASMQVTDGIAALDAVEAALALLASLPEAPAGVPVGFIYPDDLETLRKAGASAIYEVEQEFRFLPKQTPTPLYASPQVQGEVSDARRFDWLRNSYWYVGPPPEGDLAGVSWHDKNEGALNAAIDAAMKGQSCPPQ